MKPKPLYVICNKDGAVPRQLFDNRMPYAFFTRQEALNNLCEEEIVVKYEVSK